MRLTKPYRAKTILAIALPARRDGHRARSAVPREGRDRPGHRGRRHADAHLDRDRLPRRRRPQLGHVDGADLLHGLGRRADPHRPAQEALPPPAAALARLLRAQPRRRDHLADHERRGGARPARHRRRHEPRPELADADRLGRDPLLARLAARARGARSSSRSCRSRPRSSAGVPRGPTGACASGSARSPRRSRRTSPACASSRRSTARSATRSSSAT